MTDGSQSDLHSIDQALIVLRHFFDTPVAVNDAGPSVEVSTLLVLDAIARTDEAATVTDIAARLDVAHSTASRLITRAERAGMVVRAASGPDKRVTVVTATRAGAQLRQRATGYRLARLAAITGDWTAHDTAVFAQLIERFATNAQHLQVDSSP